MIPETKRKEPPREISYKPGIWKGFVRSPIRTRSRRLAEACSNPVKDRVQNNSNDESDSDTPPTPTPKPTTAAQRRDGGKLKA